MTQNQRPWFIPPIWLIIIMMLSGIIGMDFVYHAITTGTWVMGLFGLVLLVLAVFVLGTPLAYARYLGKKNKSSS